MNGPVRPESRRRGRIRLLIGGACTVALAAAGVTLPGTAASGLPSVFGAAARV